MQPHEERVIKEKEALDEKISKLEAFGFGDGFTVLASSQKDLLREQYVLMKLYSRVLGERIAAF